jgi:hypothetical protein
MTRSFSGTHEFFPQCLAELLDEEPEQINNIRKDIEAGCCPRCWGALPSPPVSPAGSRVTRCRCVPICGPCGEHEAMGLVHPGDWPLEPDDVRDELEEWYRQAETTTGIITGGPDGAPVLITEQGATTPKLRPHSGGWAEFGHDLEEG